MKSKSILVISFLLLITHKLFAENVILAPIMSVTEESNELVLKTEINNEIFKYLKQYNFENIIKFKTISEDSFGKVTSVLDANRICKILNSNYIVYGYIQKNSKSWYCNLKLYDFQKKVVTREIFVSDELQKFDRFVKLICSRTVDIFREEIGLKEQSFVDRSMPIRLDLAQSVYYWSPLTKNWINAIYGIIGTNLTTEFYPFINNTAFFFMDWRYSFRLNLSYSYGLGNQENYPANYHTITVSAPALAHLYIDKTNECYVGLGPYYEMEILHIKQNYLEENVVFQNMFGLQSIIGYCFIVNDLLGVFSELEFNFHFSQTPYASVKPSIGVRFNMY